MTRRLPLLAILLGIAGLVPFVACGLMALSPDAAQSDRMTVALMEYAAVTLAFLGGVHWGFALTEPEPRASRVERARLLLGVLPAIAGWIALLLPLALPLWVGLVVLIIGFTATIVIEHQAHIRGLLPAGYVWLRWGATIVAVAMLVTVLTLRLLGQSINL